MRGSPATTTGRLPLLFCVVRTWKIEAPSLSSRSGRSGGVGTLFGPLDVAAICGYLFLAFYSTLNLIFALRYRPPAERPGSAEPEALRRAGARP